MTPADHGTPVLAIVVPTLAEETYLPRLLGDLEGLRVPHEIVVADGGSTDGTPAIALRRGARLVRAPTGRGLQMAAGAAASTAPWIFFVHADSRLPPATLRRLETWLDQAGPRDATHLTFALDATGWFWRFIEVGQALRERITGLVYGDHGLLVSRWLYEAVGGFPEVAIMEDVAMVARLRQRGRFRRLDAPLFTSPRRYRREGRWRAWLRNTALIALFRLGVPPGRLAALYPPPSDRPRPLVPDVRPVPSPARTRPGAPEPSPTPARDPASRSPPVPGPRPDRAEPSPPRRSDILLVFAKAPRPGTVKTRLAADVGDRVAADLYRRMGRRVVDAVRGGPWHTVVAFAPSEARNEVSAWLGTAAIELRPQEGPDLGARMREAFRWALREADRVCVVGTDAPDVDEALVRRAFHDLCDHDLVVGPARDGGYYLLGMRRPLPSLFRDVPWSTSRVLEITLERAEEAGLSVARLPEMSDVDTVDDLPADRP